MVIFLSFLLFFCIYSPPLFPVWPHVLTLHPEFAGELGRDIRTAANLLAY